MERVATLTDEEIVSRILGIPMERVRYLQDECGMPVDEEGFSGWFVENSVLVLQEMREYGRIAQMVNHHPSSRNHQET
jgi:hypothetical protein